MRVELSRQLRRRRTWLALAGLALVPVIISVALVLTGGDDGGNGGDPTGLFSLATASGLNLTLVTMVSTSGFLLPAVVALYTGDTVAGESSWGSLRYLLARPVGRSRLLARKLGVAVLLGAAAAVLVPLSGMAAGTVAFGWGPVRTPFGTLAAGTAIARIAVATAYLAWSCAWVAALSFMLSTMTEAPVGAVASAMVVIIVVQLLDAITGLGVIREYLPVHEQNAWVALLASPPRAGELLRGVVLQVPYAAVFLGAAWWWFDRRDVLS